jgi:hypothetical protein
MLKNGINNIYIYGTIFLKTLANIFLQWLKFDLFFINLYELQIIFSFNFF